MLLPCSYARQEQRVSARNPKSMCYSSMGEEESLFDASHRHTLTFEDYSSELSDVLERAGAPTVLIDALKKVEETIMHDRAYTAPEAMNDAADKTRLFEAFCDLDLMTAEAGESPRTQWRPAACRFFEENR